MTIIALVVEGATSSLEQQIPSPAQASASAGGRTVGELRTYCMNFKSIVRFGAHGWPRPDNTTAPTLKPVRSLEADTLSVRSTVGCFVLVLVLLLGGGVAAIVNYMNSFQWWIIIYSDSISGPGGAPTAPLQAVDRWKYKVPAHFDARLIRGDHVSVYCILNSCCGSESGRETGRQVVTG